MNISANINRLFCRCSAWNYLSLKGLLCFRYKTAFRRQSSAYLLSKIQFSAPSQGYFFAGTKLTIFCKINKYFSLNVAIIGNFY